MTKLFVSLFAVFLAVGFIVQDAEARRFGGGGSFGIQRSAPIKRVAPTTAPAQPTTASGQRGVWGAIGGLAAGLGLAALFSHLGLGEEMASFFMVALLVFAAVMIFRRLASGPQSSQQSMAYAGHQGPGHQATMEAVTSTVDGRAFDEAAFARQAKLNFIRLQAAYDEGNLEDIRAFTSPEVFAEVRMQYEERGGASQKTDVLELNAEVIEVAREGHRYVVSVRFTGLIREDVDTSPAPFDEIWHLTKPVDGDGGWVVSGIQQTH